MKQLALVLAACVSAAVIGYLVGASGSSGSTAAAAPPPAAKPQMWWCPMDPQIKRPNPGSCPICGMALEPFDESSGDAGPGRVALTKVQREMARVETSAVERRFLVQRMRLAGRVEWDASRTRVVSARSGGRLERLFVDSVGVEVRAGDHLVVIDSPELVTAQQELIEALRISRVKGRSEILAGSDQMAVAAARAKLVEFGLSEEQIDAIAERSSPEESMQIDSPVQGVVIEKLIEQGDYVTRGQRLYRIADLDRLWVHLDVFERDLSWLRYGQAVTVEAAALPSDRFTGWISFVDPIVDSRTRTVRVRVVVDNHDRRLKPGMFVRALVEARLADAGRVLDPRLAGKWISPMHPEIVKDGPGTCDVCGMDLVPAEQLGFVGTDATERPLVVPETAVLLTGERAVVFVESKEPNRRVYEMREVELGPRAEDHYVIVAGVAEGEPVVVRGAFQLDASLQLSGKASMLDLTRRSLAGPEAADVREAIRPAMDAYLAAQVALAADDGGTAHGHVAVLREALRGATPPILDRRVEEAWSIERAAWLRALDLIAADDDLDTLRQKFHAVSNAALNVVSTFGHDRDAPLYEVFCPMAFEHGAAWLQADDVVANPYYGSGMLRCGTVRGRREGVGK